MSCNVCMHVCGCTCLCACVRAGTRNATSVGTATATSTTKNDREPPHTPLAAAAVTGWPTYRATPPPPYGARCLWLSCAHFPYTVCLSLSLYVSVSVSVSSSLSVSVALSVPLSVSVSPSLSLSLSRTCQVPDAVRWQRVPALRRPGRPAGDARALRDRPVRGALRPDAQQHVRRRRCSLCSVLTEWYRSAMLRYVFGGAAH